MFEAVEVGRRVRKQDFRRLEPELSTRLLAAQREVQAARIPVIVIVSGVEGAGKGEVVNRLNQWLDSRGMRSVAFWDESDEERERPRYWRFARQLPERGEIGVLFGSWYTRPIIDRAYGEFGKGEFDRQLDRIARFERTLVDDGALIVKLWFHLSKKTQRRRLRKDVRDGRRDVSPLTRQYSKRYDAFAAASEQAIRRTDHGDAAWHVIEAEDRRYRDLATGFILLDAMQRALEERTRTPQTVETRDVPLPSLEGAATTILDHVDLSARLEVEDYERELDALQQRLRGLAWDTWKHKGNVVAVFEGWDAAGKGGAIRRVTRAVDARLYRVIQIAAPSDEELAHHYLWRFWRHLPRAGQLTVYDRSWYGRVLVERVEGLARPDEWMRAYGEINDFEEQLCDHGIALLKFWLHVDADEQLRRFREREQTPHKAWKITEEDWRNREKRGEYEAAVNEMVARTSTAYAPWEIVPGNDKRHGRIQVLERVCRAYEALLK